MFKAQSSKLSGSSSHHESGSHHSLLHLILRDGALHLSDEDIGSLLSYCHASLLHGGKHWVGSLGTVTIRKTAYADIIRNAESHSLSGIENSDGGIIVDGKEGIRMIFLFQYLRCQSLSLRTVVAELHPVGILRESMLHQAS